MVEIEKLKLPGDFVKIKEIELGFKQRKKYIIETTEGKYFIKILPEVESLEEIEKRKWIHKIYEKENISLVPLLDVIVQDKNTILISNYLEGTNLKKSLFNLEQCDIFGTKVAMEVKKMNEIKTVPDFFHVFDLKKHCDCYINLLKKILNERNEEMIHLFSNNEIKELISRFQKLCDVIIGDEVVLNHNDIKLSNIMLDKKDNFYLVDIDPIDLTYRGYNINYSIYNFLLDDEKANYEKAFLRGFIREYDYDKSLIKQWEYFMISDFINELENLLNHNYDYLKNNISFIKKVLFNENNILNRMLYH